MRYVKNILFLLTFLSTYFIQAQCENLSWNADINSICGESVMTMIHDQKDRPYLYVASKEGGLKVFDISILSAPQALSWVSISALHGLHVMNITQVDTLLFLALGNHFTNPSGSAMAIVSVNDPANPNVLDIYDVPNSGSGGGAVAVEGDYAYFAAMKSGLYILNVSDPRNIIYESHYYPDIHYPTPNPSNLDLYNIRGLVVRNSIVYSCFDAGGIRIINCTNKSNPIQTGRYANPALFQPFNLPRAYNNVVLKDSLLFVAVDYCGVEILNIADTSNISLHGWWNPYNCPNNNWFSSPSHANELHLDSVSNSLFVSTGKSDLVVLDVTDPSQPDSCSFYGGTTNNIGTWGVGLYQDQVYLSYICTLGIPFASNWSGVKILSRSQLTSSETQSKPSFSLYPNPSNRSLTIEGLENKLYDASIFDSSGRLLKKIMSTSSNSIDVSNLERGNYFLMIEKGLTQAVLPFVKY